MLLMHIDCDMGRLEQREKERNRTAESCKSLDSFFLLKKPKVAEDCTTSAAALPTATGSQSSLSDLEKYNVSQTLSEIVDVTVDV